MAVFHNYIFSAEDLVLRDINSCLGELFVISSGEHPRSSSQSICKSILEECLSSSSCHIADTVYGRRASDLRNQLFVNTRSEIIETKYIYVGIPFIFKWY